MRFLFLVAFVAVLAVASRSFFTEVAQPSVQAEHGDSRFDTVDENASTWRARRVQRGHSAASLSDSHSRLVSRSQLTTDSFAHDNRATFHPHGDQVCASGCAATRHPTEELTRYRFQQLLANFSDEPIDEPGLAFETLLYFGRQSAAWLERAGAAPLDPMRAALLRAELKQTHAEVSIHVVDEVGEIRATLHATRVPLDRRHEFKLDPHNLQPLIASGTVKRVGRDHVWTRL